LKLKIGKFFSTNTNPKELVCGIPILRGPTGNRQSNVEPTRLFENFKIGQAVS